MKIEINDIFVNEFLDDVGDACVARAMQRIIDDEIYYPHPDDVKYQKKIKKAAKLIHNHFTLPELHI